MGNQRRILQVEPRQCLGAIVRVRREYSAAVRDKLECEGRFYTMFLPAGEPVQYPNLDGPDVNMGMLHADYVGIQSGGKIVVRL